MGSSTRLHPTPAAVLTVYYGLVFTIVAGLSQTAKAEDPASAPRSTALPVTNLKPSDVVEKQKVRMSLASLYRSVEANKFYCVVPAGQSNGREFPEWQWNWNAEAGASRKTGRTRERVRRFIAVEHSSQRIQR